MCIRDRVFATLGSKYEKVNGVVDYAELALGPKYAYYVGWFMTTIYTPALASMLAFFSAMMFLQLFGISSIDFANGQVNAVAIGVGAGFLMIGYGINALSPKIAGKLQVGMTVIKLIPLILMGVAGTIAGLVNGTTLEVLDYVNSADYVAVDGKMCIRDRPKGEFVLVIDGAPDSEPEFTLADALTLVEHYRSEGLSRKAACKKASAETGLSPKTLYDSSLEEH